ncbi:hypothetical protein B5E84_01000 [Lachnoclostridium sp. An14]|uniref:LysR family transcriptional regulator n=1 Tax=Lachnoclostridium sp. An14 TaxID=1965562 RepID=UPI000B36B365|nr:LysR family transcriptional regulator [Lachnoclostridium sp. An14]OUQ21869.1 hypothetical protein B5E84_01000 [Lachnoclostridium sp. An14]
MTLLDIETFLAVVKYGNLSVAAQNLFISQPALTRRLQYMEQELGYPLIVRQKGHRAVQLTEQGREFYRIAWKWQLLLEETNSISFSGQRELLSVAAVNSVGRYLLAPVFPEFFSHKFRLRLYNAFSEDAYQYMEQGLYDLAFIEQQDFIHKNAHGIFTKPAFSESFVIASYQELPVEDGGVLARSLKPEQEIYVPWNNEFKFWHSDRFNNRISPVVFLEDVSLLECFLLDERWVVVPAAMGRYLESKGAHVYSISDAPPNRIIYYLTKGDKKETPIKLLISLLDQYLRATFHNEIKSLLRDGET